VDTTASEGTLLDDGEMTDMVDRLRESGDATVDRVENDQDIALEDVEPA
jgi:hypothetical protein